LPGDSKFLRQIGLTPAPFGAERAQTVLHR
jgi:hypothetical protein